MAILKIITGEENPLLRQQTKEVGKVTKDVKKLLKDMEETVQKVQGAGLAGPQVSKSLRLCIAAIGGKYTPLINPHITWKSKETDVMEEGCLSLPEIWRNIERPIAVQVTYQNLKGEEQERKFEGFDARVVQHELDHLDGVLIVDHLDVPQPVQ